MGATASAVNYLRRLHPASSQMDNRDVGSSHARKAGSCREKNLAAPCFSAYPSGSVPSAVPWRSVRQSGLMKRLAVFLAGLLVLVGAFFILAPRLVSIEGVRRSLAHEIAGWSGRALAFDGTPTISFTPYLTVTFPHAVIGSKTGLEPLVVMESLSAEIPILPLLFQGQLEPSAFDFRKPVFHFAVDARGTPNWTLPEGLDATSRVGRLTIIDGTIGYDDQLGRKVDISGIDPSYAGRGRPRLPASRAARPGTTSERRSAARSARCLTSSRAKPRHCTSPSIHRRCRHHSAAPSRTSMAGAAAAISRSRRRRSATSQTCLAGR